MAKYDTEYVSEFARFMNDYLKDHPEVVADQHIGRAIYWDKHVDLDELERAEHDAVPVDSYYYFGNPWPRETGASSGTAAQDSTPTLPGKGA